MTSEAPLLLCMLADISNFDSIDGFAVLSMM